VCRCRCRSRLAKGESLNLHLNVTAYELAPPGEVSFNLRATCPTCSGALFGTDVLVRNIEVPVLRSLEFTSETYEITGSDQRPSPRDSVDP